MAAPLLCDVWETCRRDRLLQSLMNAVVTRAQLQCDAPSLDEGSIPDKKETALLSAQL